MVVIASQPWGRNLHYRKSLKDTMLFQHLRPTQVRREVILMKMGQCSFIQEGWRTLEQRRLSLDTGGRVGFAGPQADSSNTKEGRNFFFFSSGKLLLPFINLPWVKLSSYRFITVLLAFRQIWYCGVVVCWLSRRSKTSIFERYFHWFYICLIGFFTLVL